MAEEEEASRAACSLAGLKDHIAVELRAQTAVEAVKIINTKTPEHPLESANPMRRDLHFLLHDQHVILSGYGKLITSQPV